MTQDPLQQLTLRLRDFVAEREWEQFHTSKNLAMAITGEAGELAAEFQWLSPDECKHLDPERLERVKQEAADVLLYLARLADVLGFDLMEAANQKIDINATKYPAEKVRGSAKKYTEL